MTSTSSTELQSVPPGYEAFQKWVNDPMQVKEDKFFRLLKKYREAQEQLDDFVKARSRKEDDIEESADDEWSINTSSERFYGYCNECGNHLRVEVTQEEAEMSDEALSEVRKMMHDLRVFEINSGFRAHMNAGKIKQDIVDYIDSIFGSHPEVRLPSSAPISMVRERDPRVQEGVLQLENMLNVLFFFCRTKPNRPNHYLSEFYKTLHSWIYSISGALLRTASVEDHLFLLGHLLHCPDMASWATELIQFPKDVSEWNDLICQHFIRTIEILVTPISQVEQFVKKTEEREFQFAIMFAADPECRFELKESDLLSSFELLPFKLFFDFIEKRRRDTPSQSEALSPIVELFKVLCASLDNVGQYNNFASLAVRTMILTLQDIGSSLKAVHQPNDDEEEEDQSPCQAVIEQLFFELMHVLFNTQHSALYKFLAELPYSVLTVSSLWRVLGSLVMTVVGDSKDSKSPLPRNMQEWREFQQASQLTKAFLDDSENLRTDWVIQSMTQLAVIANDYLFCHEVCFLFFDFFRAEKCPDSLVKSTVKAIGTLCCSYGNCVDDVVMAVDDTLSSKSCPKSFPLDEILAPLPLDRWCPSDGSFVILQKWLMLAIKSKEFHAARTILNRLSWQNLSLIPVRNQRRFAALLVRCWVSHNKSRELKQTTTDIFNTLSGWDGIDNTTDVEPQKIVDWIWFRLLNIQYFVYESGSQPPVDEDDTESETSLNTLLSEQAAQLTVSASKCNPLLLFAVALLSPFGINLDSWVKEPRAGFTLLNVINSKSQHVAVSVIIQQLFPVLLFRSSAKECIIKFQCPILYELLNSIFWSSIGRKHKEVSVHYSWCKGENRIKGETSDLDLIVASHIRSLKKPLNEIMARFWTSVAIMESSQGIDEKKKKRWFQMEHLQSILETVCCSWFTFRLQRMPIYCVRKGLALPGICSFDDKITNSVFPESPNPSEVGAWLKSFASPNFMNFSWSVFHVLFLETAANVSVRVSQAQLDEPPKNLKVCQWAEYARYYSVDSKETDSPIAVLFWQMTLHLFFDFPTSLRPCRFVNKSPQMKKAQSLIIDGLEKLIPELRRTNNSDLAVAFSKALTLVQDTDNLENVSISSLPEDAILRKMLVSSPFSDSSSLFCDCIDTIPLREKLSGSKEPSSSSDQTADALLLPVDGVGNKRVSRQTTAVEKTNGICDDGLAALSIKNPHSSPSCGFEASELGPFPVDISVNTIIDLMTCEVDKVLKQKRELDDYDDRYARMIPDLYDNDKRRETRTVQCDNRKGEEQCQGKARIQVTVHTASKDSSVKRKMEDNRSEAHDLAEDYIHVDDSFLLNRLKLYKTVHVLIHDVMKHKQGGKMDNNAYSILLSMFSTISRALEKPTSKEFDPVYMILQEILVDMAHCLMTCDYPDAYDRFISLSMNCSAPHQMEFLATLFNPPSGEPFLVLFEKAISLFSQKVTQCSFLQALQKFITRFGFSRWLTREPVPDQKTIDRAIEILINVFCSSRGVKDNLTNYIRQSLQPILSSCSFESLVFFVKLALRHSLSSTSQLCCLTPSVWSASDKFPWKALDISQRALILRELTDVLTEAKQNSLFVCVDGIVTPICSIIYAVKPEYGQLISDEEALLLSEGAMNLFRCLFVCTERSKLPWLEGRKEDKNGLQIMNSIFSLIGSCAMCLAISDPETSLLLMENVWQLVTDDTNGMIGKHSFEVKFPPPYIQNVLLQSLGSSLPWQLWNPKPEALVRARDIISLAEESRSEIKDKLSYAFLIIMTNVCRNGALAAAEMADSRSLEDISTLAWCIIKSFTGCKDMNVFKQLESSFANSVSNIGLWKLPTNMLRKLTSVLSTEFKSRIQNRDTNEGNLCPLSYLLSIVVCACGISYPRIASCSFDTVEVTDGINFDQIKFCVSVIIELLTTIRVSPNSSEQAVVQAAIKAFLAGSIRIAANEDKKAGSQGTVANDTFERLTLSFLVNSLSLGPIRESTESAIKECLTEGSEFGSSTQFLRVLTKATSATITMHSETSMTRLVLLAAAAVDTFFTNSSAWLPLVTAFAVPESALKEFTEECLRNKNVQLLHLVWLSNKTRDPEHPGGQLLSWMNTAESSDEKDKDYFFVLLIMDALSAGVPPDGTAFESTIPYADHLALLLKQLDNMHNDCAFMKFFTRQKPYSHALQLFASGISQFIKLCLFTDKNKKTFVRTRSDDPRGPIKAAQSQNKSFSYVALTADVIKEHDKEAMNLLIEKMKGFIENPETTICKWRDVVGLFVHSLWPLSVPLAEI